jgi:hypothetical protein
MLGSSSFASEAPLDRPGLGDRHQSAPAVLIVADDATSAKAAGDAAALIGARVVSSSGFPEAATPPLDLPPLDMVLIEAAQAEPDMLDLLLQWGHSVSEHYEARLVLCFSAAQLDQVVAQATASEVQLLCDPTMADRLAALAIAGRHQTIGFGGANESESERLRRLSDEVVRIAEALTRLSGADASRRPGAREAFDHTAPPHDGYRFETEPAQEAEEPLPKPGAIRSVIRARRLREHFFDAQLFADPAWDMLLDLMAARLEKVSVSVSSLCIAAAVPPTTALRWITTMTEAGLFQRDDDPHDRRRAYIALTDKAFEGMRAYAGALRRMGLHLL